MTAKKPRLKWDKQAHASYITIESKTIAYSKEVASGIIIDFDSSGNVVGIEIL